MGKLVKYSESALAKLLFDRVYLIEKRRDAVDRGYTVKTGAYVSILGHTFDAEEYGYPGQNLYWAEYNGYTFGVIGEEVEFIG